MNDSVMLYKYPGKHKIHEGMFDYVIVHATDVYRHLENGWYKSTKEAREAYAKVPKKLKPAKKKNKRDLKSSEVRRIKNATGTIKDVAKRYNVTEYAVKKIRG